MNLLVSPEFVDGLNDNIDALLIDAQQLNVCWIGDSIWRRVKMGISGRVGILVWMAILVKTDFSSLNIVDVVIVRCDSSCVRASSLKQHNPRDVTQIRGLVTSSNSQYASSFCISNTLRNRRSPLPSDAPRSACNSVFDFASPVRSLSSTLTCEIASAARQNAHFGRPHTTRREPLCQPIRPVTQHLPKNPRRFAHDIFNLFFRSCDAVNHF